jgi:hypothetical protein
MEARMDKSDDGSEEATKRIKFNVGGQIYEISRDIVMSHPDTMLARITSETWQKDPTETIFINGDGERFRYVLDYLRTGSICLPLTVPKPAILKDLEYYGFENVNPDDIDGCSANFEAATHMSKMDAHVTKNVKALKLDAAYSLISYECCKYYSNGGAQGQNTFTVNFANSGYQGDKQKNLLDECVFAFQKQFDSTHFNKRLAEYGLYFLVHDSRQNRAGVFLVGILSKRKKSG